MCTVLWKTGCFGITEITFLQENFYLNSRVFYSLNMTTCSKLIYIYIYIYIYICKPNTVIQVHTGTAVHNCMGSIKYLNLEG